MCISSAKAGKPFMPNSTEFLLSLICDFPAMDLFSGYTINKASKPLAYCRARLMKPSSCKALSPSEKATAPACCISNSSASSLASRFWLMAPTGNTSTRLFLALFTIYSTCDFDCTTGLVCGNSANPVKPPACAAAVRVWISSLVSKPGSPAAQFKSKKPGLKKAPCPSKTVSFLSAVNLPMFLILPSSTLISHCWLLNLLCGSAMVTFLTRRFILFFLCY
ncbi:hypothetical protein D3C73_1040560 [compost metagenome]